MGLKESCHTQIKCFFFLLLTELFNLHVYVSLQHSLFSWIKSVRFPFKWNSCFQKHNLVIEMMMTCACVCVCFSSLYSMVHILTEHLTPDRDGARWKCLLFTLLIWGLQSDFGIITHRLSFPPTDAGLNVTSTQEKPLPAITKACECVWIRMQHD